MINNIEPIILHWHLINIRWYGVLLALGVLLSVLIIVKLFKKNNLKTEEALDLSIWLAIGGLIGARLGHILFYEANYYFSHPSEIIFINHGGLSSHGLTIGLLLTFLIYTKIKKLEWKKVIDLLVIPIPLLAMFIRIGNFFNSEIVGRATDLPWGVYFPNYENNPILRHPTQLYEALLLFTIYYLLFTIYKKYSNKLPQLFIFHLFLILYFGGRFLLEFTKEYQTSWEGLLTAGQWLSLPFIFWSIYWLSKSQMRV